jgi:hypothetical protein
LRRQKAKRIKAKVYAVKVAFSLGD